MSNQTYAEARGVEPFDWWHALNNPHLYDLEDLAFRAGGWITCACGNQCDIIPRKSSDDGFYDGQPEDETLNNLGLGFSQLVYDREWEKAKLVLADIEARSEVLIAEIKGE